MTAPGAESARRPRLDYVSPWPPVRSGIADYSADLVPRLAERVDLRLIRLPDQPVAPEIEARWSPRPIEALGEDGRLPLYQMGNNPYHEAIWDLARRRPGLLTLHDLVLHHLLLHRTLGRRDWDGYEEAMRRDHGWLGVAAGRLRAWSLEDQASLFALPAHRDLLRRQRGILVHSRWAAEKIREDDPVIAVRTIPMAIPLPPEAPAGAARALRDRLGLGSSTPLLGSFGFQTPIKRTGAVVEALARPELAGVHLLIAGEVSPELDFAALSRRLGVAERVHVLGFLPFDELEAAIAAVDLCLNLRYPTAGETSASLLRVLALGKPAIVSDYGQFAELPEEVVARTPVGEGESEALAATVAELLSGGERLADLGEAARRHVRREHDPERAARLLAVACAELADHEPPGPVSDPRETAGWTPSSLTWSDLPGKLRVEGAETPWPEGERRRLRIVLENASPARWLASHRGAGGIALEARWLGGEAGRPLPWAPLPRDLDPGDSIRFDLELRRPLGPCALRLAVRRLGAEGTLPAGARTPSLEVAV